MDCPICDGELRYKTTNNENNKQCYCTRCRKYAHEFIGHNYTIWIGKLELYGTQTDITSSYRYKIILIKEKLKYRLKKIIQKIFKNY